MNQEKLASVIIDSLRVFPGGTNLEMARHLAGHIVEHRDYWTTPELPCTCDYSGLEGEPHKPFCEKEYGPHAECATRAEVTRAAGDELAASVTDAQFGESVGMGEHIDWHRVERAVDEWKEVR